MLYYASAAAAAAAGSRYMHPAKSPTSDERDGRSSLGSTRCAWLALLWLAKLQPDGAIPGVVAHPGAQKAQFLFKVELSVPKRHPPTENHTRLGSLSYFIVASASCSQDKPVLGLDLGAVLGLGYVHERMAAHKML
jgi:hypothetical protein